MDLMGRFFVSNGGNSIRSIVDASGEPLREEMAAYGTAKELDRMVACEGLDAILSPTTPYAALKNGDFKTVSYTGVYNILDLSATSFPTGITANKEKDTYAQHFKSFGEVDDVTKRDYDAEAVHGMPVSLQLVGKRLEEERILDVTQRVVQDLARAKGESKGWR
ncbi:hypothetical protein LTR62_002647 [Meristemomyces frigidus]|uniref:Amidase domain-containing protein n=1 Tax=Meristemomyces frigidus TaxID=1508187 RepID=A0AAN7T8J0_9PEZI|nr:hypothetical protein LTR62_002647 [Meristemomyces frigidus]